MFKVTIISDPHPVWQQCSPMWGRFTKTAFQQWYSQQFCLVPMSLWPIRPRQVDAIVNFQEKRLRTCSPHSHLNINTQGRLISEQVSRIEIVLRLCASEEAANYRLPALIMQEAPSGAGGDGGGDGGGRADYLQRPHHVVLLLTRTDTNTKAHAQTQQVCLFVFTLSNSVPWGSVTKREALCDSFVHYVCLRCH